MNPRANEYKLQGKVKISCLKCKIIDVYFQVYAKCIMELERIKGISHGGNRGNQYLPKQDNLTLPNQSDIAEELKISKQQLQDYKKLTTLIPENFRGRKISPPRKPLILGSKKCFKLKVRINVYYTTQKQSESFYEGRLFKKCVFLFSDLHFLLIL